MVDDQHVQDDEHVVIRTDIQQLGGRNTPCHMQKIANHLWHAEINLVGAAFACKVVISSPPTIAAIRTWRTLSFRDISISVSSDQVILIYRRFIVAVLSLGTQSKATNTESCKD